MSSDFDNDETFELQPAQGKSPEERARTAQFLPPVEDTDSASKRGPLQFRLPVLFVITGFCAFGLMATHWENQTVFAGVLGFAALLATWILCIDPPESWQMQSVCWGLLISYALACAVALIG